MQTISWQQIEQALSALSREQVSFESSIKSRIDVLEHEIQQMQTSKAAADALQGEMASMKAVVAKLEVQYHEQEGRARNRYEEIMKSVSGGHERSNELDTRLKLAMERIVGSERLREKLRKADDDLETQFGQLKGHSGDESQRQHQAAATIPSSSDSSQRDTPQTPRASKGPVEFKMTPQMNGVTWQVDDTAGWYDDGESEGTKTRPSIGITSSPPGLLKHMKKAVEVPQSSWKLLKDMPKLNANAAEAWERGVAFRQWTTEMAAISEAIHPSFAEYFRNKLDEGRIRYEKRLEQGFDEPPPAVRPEDRELETRLSLALLKILTGKMKTHALERGNTLDGISVAALLEAIYEEMTPGGIREKNSLLQYLRSPPASNTGEELTATLRRCRLAQQRARHLDIPQQAARETVAALDAMVRPLERKHQPLGVRLGILRLQSNIQIPTVDGVEFYLKILEAEAVKLQAEDISKPKNTKADSEEYSIPNANQAAAGGKGGTRLCAYFNTARGCLKGAECKFRHEAKGTGKGAKGSEKGGGKSGEPKAKAKATPKAEAKAAAKAAGKAEAEEAVAAEARAEAKRKAKADKKAAKAAAKAAATTAASTTVTAASVTEDAIPFLAVASPNTSSSSNAPRVSMAQEGTERGSQFEEENEVVSLVGADSANEDELSDRESHDVSDVDGIPMHADASTPEWSEVEQGQFPSPATTPRSDSEVELIGVRGPPAPLWVLNLTLSDYVAWTRQGHVQPYAHNPFEEETNPNSIMWPTWWTIASDQLSDDEDGTIHVVDEVCMLRCTTTMVLFEDGIIRPVFVVWLLEKVSGRERAAALIREQSRPIIRPWTAQELSKAAPPKKGGSLVTSPGVHL